MPEWVVSYELHNFSFVEISRILQREYYSKDEYEWIVKKAKEFFEIKKDT